MKLNLGCGQTRIPGFVGVDMVWGPGVDQAVNLEITPWPWETDSVTEVHAAHVLEHIGADVRTFLAVWQELYRVCAPGALLHLYFPDPLSEGWFGDPTHCRPITPAILRSFDRAAMLWGHSIGAGKHTDWGIDFQALRTVLLVHEGFRAVPQEILKGLVAVPNVVRETYHLLVAHKPGRTQAYTDGRATTYEIAWQASWDRQNHQAGA